MTRLEAVKQILNKLEKNELLIVTTGYLSRDVHAVEDRPENFYMAGSMGLAFPIGLGIALHMDRKVSVISGDGAALMCLESLVLGNYHKLKNLTHYIIDSGSYVSTGGQLTCSGNIDFTQFFQTVYLPITDDGTTSPRLPFDGEAIRNRFMNSLKE